jgi:deoxyribonuclease-4
VGICLDTCHVWDAGYDLKDFEKFITQYEEFNLLKHTRVIHVNDSKNPIGAHKDRHANLDQGYIGLKALKTLLHSPHFKDMIMILETPWTDDGPIYDLEIKMLQEK